MPGASPADHARIDDYAVIGNGRSAALIGRDGAVDWLCWPRFDSPPLFAAMLDPHGGAWTIRPTAPARTSRRYLDGTNVLATRFETTDGTAVVTDFMPVASETDKHHLLMPEHELVRCVAAVRGTIEVMVEVALWPDFRRARATITDAGRLGIRCTVGSQLVTLRGDVPLTLGVDGVARARLVLRAGDTATFSLAFDAEGPAVLPPLELTRDAIERTCAWWRGWTAGLRYDGPDRALVERSALALKLMVFAPSGAIIAAPTTSLPERIGGDLNWDYRLCWLRDAAFTARVLLTLGAVDEAKAFTSWLVHTTALTRPALRILYDVYGNRPPRERVIAAMAGFRGSTPVRVGNAARSQLQLDTYGEVIDSVAQLVTVTGELSRDAQDLIRDFSGYVVRNWRRPDQGIWEPRSPARDHTHSRVLCWVAVDRVLELARRGIVTGVDRDLLAAQRTAIRADIEAHAWNRTMQSYASELGGDEVDASLLLMAWYDYQRADAPRMRRTYERVVERLTARRGLLYRNERGVRGDEGAFWICSFWAVEYLARAGRYAEAERMYAAARSYANDLGLMAEEVDPLIGEALGNFPQAYTHVGLISAALTLAGHHVDRAAA